jgi:hypothetical protein
MKEYTVSDLLFARPSFLEGVARNIDLFGVLNTYNYAENEAEADAMAIAADWAAVYHDMNKAYNALICQIETKEIPG